MRSVCNGCLRSIENCRCEPYEQKRAVYIITVNLGNIVVGYYDGELGALVLTDDPITTIPRNATRYSASDLPMNRAQLALRGLGEGYYTHAIAA